MVEKRKNRPAMGFLINSYCDGFISILRVGNRTDYADADGFDKLSKRHKKYTALYKVINKTICCLSKYNGKHSYECLKEFMAPD